MPSDISWRTERAAGVSIGDLLAVGPDSISEVDSNEPTDASGGHEMVRIETQDGCVLVLPAMLSALQVGSIPGVERV